MSLRLESSRSINHQGVNVGASAVDALDITPAQLRGRTV